MWNQATKERPNCRYVWTDSSSNAVNIRTCIVKYLCYIYAIALTVHNRHCRFNSRSCCWYYHIQHHVMHVHNGNIWLLLAWNKYPKDSTGKYSPREFSPWDSNGIALNEPHSAIKEPEIKNSPSKPTRSTYTRTDLHRVNSFSRKQLSDKIENDGHSPWRKLSPAW